MRTVPALFLSLLLVLGSAGPALAGGPRVESRPSQPCFIGDADGDRLSDDLGSHLKAAAAGGGRAPVVVTLTERPTDDVFARLQTATGAFKAGSVWTEAVNGFSAELTVAQILALSKSSLVQRIDYDRPVSACMSTARQWTGVEQAWVDFGVTGDRDGAPASYSKNDVVICILDTGIDATHVDLDGGKVIGWKDFVYGLPFPYDDNGHGTHCAAIAAGTGEGNPAYRGVAPGAALVGVKVLDYSGTGSTSAIISGINWMIANKSTYGIRIGSLSLGSAGPSDGTDSLSLAVNNAVRNGIIMCVAAGNGGPGSFTIGSPAAAASAITVGAAADPGEGGWVLADFSGRGPTADGRTKPDICAPGMSITSAAAGTGNGYVTMSGTSMATPFCAGVVALMLSANYGLTDAGVKNILYASSNVKDVGPPGKDIDSGYGLSVAYRAVRQAGGWAAPWSDGLALGFVSGFLSGSGDYDLIPFNVARTDRPVGITMVIDDWDLTLNDFDLYLYDPSGHLVGYSEGVLRQEQIYYYPAMAGDYTAEVCSYSGSGTYWVDISTQAPSLLLTETGGSTAVTEGGATDTYTVALDRRPGWNVVVTAAATPGRLTVNGGASTTLVFTPDNWALPQTVSVAAVDDPVVEGPHSGTITHTLSAGDVFDGPALAVSITDNDAPSVTVTESGGNTSVAEGSTTADTYTVVLGSQPTANVTVTAAVTDGRATVNGAASAALVFTPTNWNVPKTVTVRAVDDAVIEGPHTSVITHTATGAGFDGVLIPSVKVNITDNDYPGVPPGLTAATSPDGVMLRWQPPSGAAPTGYEVYIAAASTAAFTKVADVTGWDGGSPNREITAADLAGTGLSLEGGRTYYFKLKSFVQLTAETRVTSPFSPAVSAVAGPVPPLPPTGVTEGTSATGIHLGWTAPATGVVPQGYDVFIAAASTGPWTPVKSVTSWEGAAPNCEVTVLDFSDGHGGYTYAFTPGRTYYFQVRSFIVHSVAGKLTSGPSAAVGGKAGPPAPGAPTYPTAATTASGPATGVHLAWKAPTSGPVPAGYSVWVSASSTGPYTFVKDVTSWEGPNPGCDVTVLDFNGEDEPVFALKGGVRYYFKLYSFVLHPLTGDKVSSLTAASTSAVAGPPAPGAPTYPTGATAPLGVTLSWKPPATGAVPAGYSVWISAASTGPYTFVRDVTSWDGTSPNATITAADLDGTDLGGGVTEPVFAFNGGVRYYFRIYSYTLHELDGSHVASTTAASTYAVAGPLPPNPPTAPKGTTTGDGFTLSWSAPTTGSAPTGYRIELSRSSTTGFVLLPDVTGWSGASPNVAVTGADITAAGLVYTPGAIYYVRIHSFGPHPVSGDPLVSPGYASVSVVAGPMPPNPPSYPTAATNPAGSGGGVNLTWRAPTSGPVPAGYLVYASGSSTSGFVLLKDVTSWTGTYPNCRVTADDFSTAGLSMKAGVRYYFRLYSYILHPTTGAEVPSLRYCTVSAVAG